MQQHILLTATTLPIAAQTSLKQSTLANWALKVLSTFGEPGERQQSVQSELNLELYTVY